MRSAPDALRKAVYSAFEGQMYDPTAFHQIADERGTDRREWEELEKATVSFFANRLALVMDDGERARLDGIYYMTAPSNELNAMILRERHAVVVVFNLSMHSVLRMYLQWLLVAFEATREQDEAAMIHASCRMFQLAEFSVTAVAPQLIPDSERYALFSDPVLSRPAMDMTEACINVAQLFVVGHELGHFALGHLGQIATWRSVSVGSALERLTESHQAELAADKYAVQLFSVLRTFRV